MGWRHRIRRFACQLTITCPPEDVCARQLLPEVALALFRSMSVADQQHSLRVLLTLRKAGTWPGEVEQAALLHDVGKSQARLTLFHRVAGVLLETLASRWLARLAVTEAAPWRYPFYVYVHHAEIGAALCAQAGCSPVTMALVRAHQGHDLAALPPELHAALSALRQADEHC